MAARKYSKASSRKVGRTMHERKKGTLRSGRGGKGGKVIDGAGSLHDVAAAKLVLRQAGPEQ